jgi:trimethylamine--corrinoid protein Co-methyltransferase
MTSPFSLAGTLAAGNAEIVFIMALTQACRRGNPVLYTFGPAVGNMQNGACLYYTLDKVMWKTAHVQLGKTYGVPVLAECGGAMSCRFDQQSGAEGMLFMLSAAASGANVLAGFGSTLNALGHSTEMMLIQEAYFRAAQFLARGMRTDGEHLALASIDRVGPGGEFMTDDLTLKYLRGGEFFSHELLDYSGSVHTPSSILERAHKKALAMTEGCKSPVPPDIQEALRKFFHDEIKNPVRRPHGRVKPARAGKKRQ